MFGGGAYEVTPYDAGNTYNQSNLNALNKLIELGYVVKHVHSDNENWVKYLTTDKFTSEMWNELSGTFNRVSLSDISLQRNSNYDIRREIVVEVNDPTGNTLIGQVILKSV
jgi:hypothetical protein